MIVKLSRFIAIRSPNENLREYMLKPGVNIIGRHSSSDIPISDDAASRKHAEIIYKEDQGSIQVIDLNSTNGTYLNGKKITGPREILNNDILRIGRLLISFFLLETDPSTSKAVDSTQSIVTGDLVLESIDNFSVLLHDIDSQLIDVSQLDQALDKISMLIQRMIGARDCHILMLEMLEEIHAVKIPADIYHKLVEESTASIFDLTPSSLSPDNDKKPVHNTSRLVVPVQIEGKVVAIIAARKKRSSIFPFNNSDLQVVIAVSHQVALAIQRNRLEYQLLHNATHDELTGMPTRTVFIDRVNQSLALSKRRTDFNFAVLFLDIDNFKLINDTLGHEVGDKLLVHLSRRLDEDLRNTDTLTYIGSVARFGGDEFAILLTDLNDEIDPMMVAERIRKLASIPFVIDELNLEITISLGLTTNSMGYSDPDQMLRDADIAMYRSKESGKNRVELYDREFHNKLMGRIEQQHRIRQAVELGEFRPHYQPIISLATGQIVGHEALVRWYSPDQGIVTPTNFIHLLDTENLLPSVDQWMLREACQQTVIWQASFSSSTPLYISVNFSPRNFSNPDFLHIFQQTLKETKLPPQSLWVEITESVGIDISESTLYILTELQSMGVHLCIDDFGTGYSALSYLIDLPVDALKIDTTIIRHLDVNADSQKITRAVVSLAKQLGLEVISEGIENADQLALIRSMGCDFAQGYLFSQPVTDEEAANLMGTNPKWN